MIRLFSQKIRVILGVQLSEKLLKQLKRLVKDFADIFSESLWPPTAPGKALYWQFLNQVDSLVVCRL